MLSRILKSSPYLFYGALKLKEKSSSFNGLNEKERKILEQLIQDGVAIVPNFFSNDECTKIIESFEGLDEKYAKYREDKRIFGIQCLSKIHKELFYENEFCKKIATAYLGEDVYLQTTMAAKIEPKEDIKYGSGGGWHRDSFSRQFKAIAYLNDVDIDNGPFMYIKGSHTLESIKKVLFQLKRDTYPGDYRYSENEIEKIKEILNKDITYFTAPKGTLVLADIRGLHTGMPIKSGVRYSIFNYYIANSYRQIGSQIEQLNQQNCKGLK